ncbi:MAG: di-heme oxidoredictase family protein [Gammaproteobacteria bacterium]
MVKNLRRVPVIFWRTLWIIGIIAFPGCGSNSPPPPPAPPVSPAKAQPPQPLADQRNLISQVRLSQDDINAGRIDFYNLFYAGKHIFSNRFTREDHFGEGPNGPRLSKQQIAERGAYPFLRVNGLDSQSCLECHLAIGFAAQPKQLLPRRFAKQPGITAGGAGFASNAFGFKNFGCKPDVPETDCNPAKSTIGFVRNPPHAFGAGYTQKLAQEMTITLQELRDKAIETPGVPVNLEAKGISFGTVVADAENNVDTSQVQGVRSDLVVRPFQWKGLASNLRNFITGAMNFHFSVQPTETADVVEDDLDDLRNEIDEGEISTVAIFLAHMRPPVQNSKGLQKVTVKRGEKVFQEADCSSCHVPSLKIDNPMVTVRDPRNDSQTVAEMTKGGAYQVHRTPPARQQPSLTNSYAVLPVEMEYGMMKEYAEKKIPAAKAEEMIRSHLGGYTRSLNLTDGPPETLPRLPANKDGSIDVPLYSDLKTHKMGVGLAESFPQTTDGGKGFETPEDEFLTRPLWGVADTPPWLHDGRALSLTEAIQMHASQGSEANASIDKFNNLSESDQKALITFLSTLRLPIYYPED